jgi:hypothetical protein
MDISCCICLDTKNTINFSVSVKCKHWYHSECIREWIEIKSKCPLCNGLLSGREIVSIPAEIINEISTVNKREFLEKELIITNLDKKFKNLLIKNKNLEKLLQEKQVLEKHYVEKLQESKDLLNQVVENYNDQVQKTIKAEAFTKHWNFSSKTDFVKWDQEWELLEKSLFDADSTLLKELLKEYHK